MCVGGLGRCGMPNFPCVGDVLGATDLLRSTRVSIAAPPPTPQPSISPEQSRDSRLPRAETAEQRRTEMAAPLGPTDAA